jgi:S1-C subfamily serine protease/peroxiredoxin
MRFPIRILLCLPVMLPIVAGCSGSTDQATERAESNQPQSGSVSQVQDPGPDVSDNKPEVHETKKVVIELEDKDQSPKQLTRGQIVDRADQSVVFIDTSDDKKSSKVFGSGFLIDERGWVATNWHVVDGANKAVVRFRDGQELNAEGLVAFDKDSDLAVLKLPSVPDGALPLDLGPLEPPRQGAGVSAIGHPQGFNFTVTEGIVSAVRKTSELPENISSFLNAASDTVWIQTSAAISGGNSGGPLLDEYGRVVGINSWIAAGESLGFAVHVSHLSALIDQRSETLLPLPGKRPLSELDNPLARMEATVQVVLEEYRLAVREYQLAMARAKSRQQAEQIRRSANPGPKYAARLYDIGDKNRRTVIAFQALWLVCQLDDPTSGAPHLKKALKRLAEDHIGDKGLHHALQHICATPSEATVDFLRQVIQNSPHARNQGLASIYLANMLLARQKPDQHRDEVITTLERCKKEWGDLKIQTTTVGKIVNPLLDQVKHLFVGGTAMETSGQDIDGNEFRLSDYKGKVVLLDFFADWCPHCTAMYPHERKLVNEYADKPFVILGVNTDSKDTLRQLIDKKQVTWPCWADGKNGTIATKWQVSSYPRLFLLDHEGTIKHIISGRPSEKALDKMIRDLVAKVQPVPTE